MLLEVNLHIKEGEFIALSGTSGSGKTTLLRILGGLEKAQGEISVWKDSWLNEKKTLPPQKRGIGFMFQEDALFNNMTLLENLLFAKKDTALAQRLLEITELQTLQNSYPKNLSGGQKQRVSLCRALMRQPKILLLDEPLSALDPKMRAKLQNAIITLHKEFSLTTIMVSHEPSEIYKLASRVVVLNEGKVIQDASPREVLLKTSGSQKFSFMGEILELQKVDTIFIAIISIGQQLVEIVLSKEEVSSLQVGDKVNIATKAFNPTVLKI
jgi:molybdate transport system ATP-binding protein